MKLVDHFPDCRNPYLKMLSVALMAKGIRVHLFRGWARLFIRSFVSPADIIHLHWIHPEGRVPFLALARFSSLISAVCLYKIRSKKIVWTVHNLVQHEGKNRILDKLGAQFMAQMADHIFVHGETAVPIVAKKLRISEEKISVMYHGNYASVNDTSISKKQARKNLGLPSHQRVGLFFGAMRPYKGVTGLLSAFSQLETKGKLIIAGIPEKTIESTIRKQASEDPRVDAHFRFIPQDELDNLIAACDFVVLPFRDIFSSGSLLLAMTFGKPIVVPRSGLVTDYVDDTCAYIYTNSVSGLKIALTEAYNSDDLKKRSEAVASKASRFVWSASAGSVVHCYREISGAGDRGS